MGLAGVTTAIAVLGALAAGRTQAAQAFVWAKAGMSSADHHTDSAGCFKEATAIRAEPVGASPLPLNPAGMLATGIFQGFANGKEHARFAARCMRFHGYTAFPLTTSEAAQLKGLADQTSRDRWVDQFGAGADFVQRLAKARTPIVPPLPVSKPEPLSWAGVRIDPRALVAADSLVTPGSPLLTGQAGHRLTGRLTRPLSIGGFHAPAGSIVHQVVQWSQYDAKQTHWCGDFGQKPWTVSPRHWVVCAWSATGATKPVHLREPRG